MSSATIKLFLTRGDSKSLRIAEIFGWTGVAIAAPRTELEELLGRGELDKPGVYILLGTNPQTNARLAYIGEAEVLRDRIKQHKTKEFWVSAIVLTSRDENLTKAHVKYLESRLIEEATQIQNYTLDQNNGSPTKLPESDRHDMELFISRIKQLLPLLGSNIITPVLEGSSKGSSGSLLYCEIKGLTASGKRSANGFVVFTGSQAVLHERPSAEGNPNISAQRLLLTADGKLVKKQGFFEFAKDVEFSSPSLAAAVVRGGSANGLTAWRTKDGKTLELLDEQG